MREVELLRQAAALMRERAQAATPGRWRSNAELVKVGHRRQLRHVAEVFGLADKWPNAEHIASWHPAVALAVADWLDYSASWVEDVTPHAAGEIRRRAGHAVAVARAYLGGE